MVAAGIALFLAFIGIVISISIVRREGWDGLWKRKKGFLESTHPETGPLWDKAEEKIKVRSKRPRP